MIIFYLLFVIWSCQRTAVSAWSLVVLAGTLIGILESSWLVWLTAGATP